MIVRQFLHWLRTATAGERADATNALARAYLYSDLSREDRAAMEGAMMLLLDDVSPLVRGALAQSLAASDEAPPSVIFALAGDQPDVAMPVLARSPLLLDSDLIDLLGRVVPRSQAAIASRVGLPSAVGAAIAEIGAEEACVALIENERAAIAPHSLARIVARFGHVASIRGLLLAHDDLPASTRQALIAKLSETLADFVSERDWIASERARRIAKEACEKATVILAADAPETEMQQLIRHLRESGQLTPGLLLRALLSGNVSLFEESLVELSGLPLARVVALVHDRKGAGFCAVYDRAGLPRGPYPAFREAIAAMHEERPLGARGAVGLKRRMVERVLTCCEQMAIEDTEPLLTLLRRFASEAAREEARVFCEGLVDGLIPGLGTTLIRAA